MRRHGNSLLALLSLLIMVIMALSGCGSSSPTAAGGGGSGGGTVTPPAGAPSAPTGVTATASGPTQINVNWTNAASASSYNIYRSTTNGFTIAAANKIGSAVAGPFGNTGLTAATTYYYKVTAVNANGESAPSAQVAATTAAVPGVPAPPSAPTGVIATASGSNQININWTLNASATSYNIYRSTTAGFAIAPANKVGSAVAGPFGNTGLTAAITYYYKVTAVNANGESAGSTEVSATTASAPQAPTAPTGVIATASGSTQININWTNVSGATGYNIYRSTAPNVAITPANKITLSSVAAGPYGNSGLAAGTTYYYKVTAVNANGESGGSTEVSATTPAMQAVPTGVTATGGNAKNRITWNQVAGATGYKIYWSTTPGVTKANAPNVISSIKPYFSPYFHWNLTNGVTYYYVVTDINASGQESAESNQVSATPSAAVAVAAPVISSASPANGSVGTRVTITGSNFDPVAANNSVDFNNSRAIVTSATSTQLITTVPMGATTGVITVETLGGLDSTVTNFVITTGGGGTPGVTWVPQTSGITAGLRNVAWSNSLALFVAVGDAGTILTSPDGISWSKKTIASSDNFFGITWDGTKFVVVGGTISGLGGATRNGSLWESTDGITWLNTVTTVNFIPWSITWSGTQYAVVGDFGAIFTSPDGYAWTKQNSGTLNPLSNVTWSGTQFVAVGGTTDAFTGASTYGEVVTSPDGVNWTPQFTQTTKYLYGIVWSSTLAKLVAVGGDNMSATPAILTSPNGMNWTAQNAGVNDVFYNVIWSGTQFVAVGINGIATSPDGIVWTAQNSNTLYALSGIAWSGSKYVAVGWNGTILTSP